MVSGRSEQDRETSRTAEVHMYTRQMSWIDRIETTYHSTTTNPQT
jgi:hypothetical protein